MRSLSHRPRKEEPKKEEVKEVVAETQPTQTELALNDGFDESVVIN